MESEIHKTKQANQYYKDKRYEDALDLYRQLDKQIGSSIFSLNIEMCKKKIKEKNYKIKARPHVNIAYILDANFSLPTYVSLYSLQKNKDEDTEYTIHLLAIDIQRQEIRVFESMERDDFNIKIINISDEYNKFSITKMAFTFRRPQY